MFIGSLIPRSDFSQLMHISDLVGHYETHQKLAKQQNVDFDFLDFVKAHFLSSDNHQHENSEDQNHSCQSIQVSVLLSFPDNLNTFNDITFPSFTQKVIFSSEKYLSDFIEKIIHPPILS